MKKLLVLLLLAAVLLVNCAGLRAKSKVEVVTIFYVVKVDGNGTNAKTIRAIGESLGVNLEEDARIQAKYIEQITPVLAKYHYQVRLSGGLCIIEPVPRDQLVGIENRFMQPILVVIKTKEGWFVWSSVIGPRKAQQTTVKPGIYLVESSFAGSNNVTITEVAIPDDNHKQLSPILDKEVDYLLYWPRV